MYENFEKFDMLKCYILANENTNAASELYFNRYPERHQPDSRIFRNLKNNLIQHGSFKQPRPRNYNIEQNEIQELNVLGERVVVAIKLSRCTVNSIAAKCRRGEPLKSPSKKRNRTKTVVNINEFDQIAIGNVIYEMYNNSE
ncbi:unnamed protein product [Ceutorhynchus assimilis]|uniref:DUF4817 domain-containing protein n=1 Tax=Ceutorhynchus assimilis TaxID=467358 RepID=A0A9N9MT40_9CUCU|nr:unnamed protein product [Ceutorhynchus assimilis]